MVIDWKYFFGGSAGKSYFRYYKAEINGIRVEKYCSSHSPRYCIGNMDNAKKKYKKEEELINACKNIRKMEIKKIIDNALSTKQSLREKYRMDDHNVNINNKLNILWVYPIFWMKY